MCDDVLMDTEISFPVDLSFFQGNQIPKCDDEALKPAKGMCFASFEDGYDFYQKYATKVGFDTRKYAAKKCVDGSQYKWWSACCNRQGFKRSEHDLQDSTEANLVSGNTSKKRRITRCGCPARVSFRFEGQCGWKISNFVENHNHGMVPTKHNSFMKANRKIDDLHKRFIIDCAKVNIGTTDTYKLLSEILGGDDRVGCTLVDMRNFARDMRAYVKGSDAQMLLNELKRKKELSDSFFYSFEVDCEERLKSVFWSDCISQRSYRRFGDVVAFDTTYSTNRYCMIFAPFTGKDNHGRLVTFACGLLCNEDADSFSWLFSQFICCMRQAPKLIITDQDLGMKVAVERVLSGTRHRWCMWHIMVKLSVKVPRCLHADENFKKELNSCVWSEAMEPKKFEELWENICCRYGLKDNTWLKSLYADRHYWIPSYFRDFPMSGLLRTTSISESENSFYKRFTRCGASLIEFWMNFSHGLAAQRHAAQKLDYVDQSSAPRVKTCWEIEKNAAMVFTSQIFYKVQEEIAASCNSCRISQVRYIDQEEEYIIKDKVDGDFIVVFNKEGPTYSCSCKLFCMKGILCRHIFFVLKITGVNHIPDRYLSRRWLKTCILLDDEDDNIDDSSVGDVGAIENQRLSNKLMSTFLKWMHRMRGQTSKLSSFLEAIDNAGSGLCSHVGSNNLNLMEDYYGPIPAHIEVSSPNVVKTKGSGSRLISRQEKAIRVKDKPLRRCAKCGLKARHDSRNCDKEKKK